jgi:molybdate transport system substrate-binding protein
VFAACSGKGDTKTLRTDSRNITGHITVSAATSLSYAFSKIAAKFAESYGNVSVDLNYGASTALADGILAGAPADVFASADQTNMTKLQDAKMVFGNPRTFAHNTLVIVVKPGNPKHIGSTADLPSAGTIALCALEVPCGTYAAQALTSAKVTIDESHVTRGQNVGATLDQVAEGDADAAIVYVTDAMSKADQVDTVPIPATQNVIAAYPIAAIGKTENKAATAFVRFVAGKTGQRILKQYGFLP